MLRAASWTLSAGGWRGAMCAAFGLVSAACHGFDAVATPSHGFVRVAINASGGDLDVDGYFVSVDGVQTRTLKGADVESFYVQPGTHVVGISNVAENCSLSGPATRTVPVGEGEIADVVFDVVCLATGITVTARTTGPDSPDSLRIALDEMALLRVAATGSRTIGRLTPGNHQLTILAPAHCTVAGGSSYIVAVAASKVTDVALEVSCTAVVRLPKIAFSADTVILGVYGPWIELVNVDGTGEMALQPGDSPAWSPDGTQLAFSDAFCSSSNWYDYYEYCSGGIIVADPEIGNVIVPTGGRNGAHPSWSPTGSSIVFHDLATTPDTVLDVLATLTGKPVALNITGPRSASQPAWSPDGTRIAFVCLWPAYSDLCVSNADGTGLVQLTNDAQPDEEPAWSPDGTKLAFARHPPGAYDDASASIAVMDLATGRITLLGAGANPAWSPDGSKIVFAGADGLFVMNADGSGRARLTTGSHRAPAWRPQ